MLTPTQKKTAEAVINIFETNRVFGDYAMVTLIAGDTGHLTYGRSQTTLGSGNLGKLLENYCANPGARFSARIKPYLPRFKERDATLDSDLKLHNLLRASADDPVMRDTQDLFFDEHYWKTAVRAAEAVGITSPLGTAVVYDGKVHGSWEKIRDRTNAQVGNPESAGEHQWVATYVAARRDWLATHFRRDLRRTVYRMDAFQRLIDQDFWGLELPLVVRDKEISIVTLTCRPDSCYDGPQPGTRSLSLQSPMLRGLDVRLIQLGLSDAGIDIKADDIFGRTSMTCVRQYQSSNAMPATGAIDSSLAALLCASIFGTNSMIWR